MNPGVVAQMSRRDIAFIAARGFAAFVWVTSFRQAIALAAGLFDPWLRPHAALHFTAFSSVLGLSLLGGWAWVNAERIGASSDDTGQAPTTDDTIIFTRETLVHGIAVGIAVVELVNGASVVFPMVWDIFAGQNSRSASFYASARGISDGLVSFLVGGAILWWVSNRAKKLNDDYIIE